MDNNNKLNPQSNYFILLFVLLIMVAGVFGIYIVTSPKPVQKVPKAAETAGKPIFSFDIDPNNKAGQFDLIIYVNPNSASFYTTLLSFDFSGNSLKLPESGKLSIIPNSDTDINCIYKAVNGTNIELHCSKLNPNMFSGSAKQEIVRIKMERGVDVITFNWKKSLVRASNFFANKDQVITEDRTFPAITAEEPIITPTIGVTPPKEEIITPTVVQPPPTTIKAPQGLTCTPTASGAVCSWTPVENAVNYKVKIIGETGESNYNTNTPGFTMTNGVAGKTYTFKVAAEAADGAVSDWSTTQFTVLSQQPIITPTIIITQPPATTTTTGNVSFRFSLAFQGILKKPTGSNTTMPVRITLISPNYSGDKSVKSVTFTATDKVVNKMVVWDGQQVTFNDVPQGNDYAILIKGPKHLQKRICIENPTETPPGRYNCSLGKIALKPNDVKTLDYSTVIEWSGDLPNQDGMIDSYDISLIRNYILNQEASYLKSKELASNIGINPATTTTTESLANVDINLDGIVNTMDFSLIIQSLQNRADEQ